MAIRRTDRTLESFKIFPYLAWTLVIGFSVFVYNITKELEATTEELKNYQSATEVYMVKPNTPKVPIPE